MCGIALVLAPCACPDDQQPTGAAYAAQIETKLSQRGPDHVQRLVRSTRMAVASSASAQQPSHWRLELFSAVLHLRGDALVAQPLVDAHSNVLCWNGEVFGYDQRHDAVLEDASDTQFLAQELLAAASSSVDSLMGVFKRIQGPFAIVWLHEASQRVYFGHDRFGRRSLLSRQRTTGRNLLVELAGQAQDQNSTSTSLTVDAQDLAGFCLSSVSFTDDESESLLPSSYSFDEVPSTGIYVLDLGQNRLEFHAFDRLLALDATALPTPKDLYDCALPLYAAPSSPQASLEQAANGLLIALSNAVGVRVRTIPKLASPSSSDAARVGVLFSGGLDSVVLAALTHFHVVDPAEPIDLLNVCFDAESGFRSPDRLAAEIAHQELRRLFPTRQWRLVRVNTRFEQVLAQQRAVLELMTPCDTHMDFNIGAAFWFLSRAQGELLAHTASDTDAADLNAFLREDDAALAKRTFASAVDALQLFSSQQQEDSASANVCPVLNCKRKRKDGCAFGICRVCCFRMQKTLRKWTDSANVHEQNAATKALVAMGLAPEQLPALRSLLDALHPASSYACRVHRAKGESPGEPEAPASTPTRTEAPEQATPYTSRARVLLVGIGADEQLGGYGRHRTAFVNGGAQSLRRELDKDLQRIWKRNLGRDDRCIAAHGKEARFPFLDEQVVRFLGSLATDQICDLSQPRGQGDKLVLRLAAKQLGLEHCTGLAKRAIQFGSRIAKQSNVLSFGSNRQASGDAKFLLVT